MGVLREEIAGREEDPQVFGRLRQSMFALRAGPTDKAGL